MVSFIVQAVLVIIAVLVFSFFDPFGFMGSKKKKLLDTPITVSSIKEIGKFISAEYYGEVLSSLSEITVTQFDNAETKDEIKQLHHDFKFAMADIRGAKKGLFWRSRLLNYFHDHYPDIIEDPYYDKYIEYLKKELREDTEREIVALISADTLKLKGINPESISSELKKITADELAANKKSIKQQIVLLGRGWVKAGINFEKFTQANFRYIPAHRSVYLIGMQPEIISCTINPWFIPEEGVKGFELILYTGKANDPNLIKKVKQDCLDKLRQSAMDQDILGKARENAKENLKTFFSLLVEDGIKDVFFVDDSLEAYKSEILRDSIISGEELSVMDTILAQSGRGSYDSVSVKAFMDEMKTKTFFLNNKRDSLNCFSSLVHRVIADQAVDTAEYDKLKELKKSIDAPFPNEYYWFATEDTAAALRTEKRKEWFTLAINSIDTNINQLIITESGNERYTKNKASDDSTITKKFNFLRDFTQSEN